MITTTQTMGPEQLWDAVLDDLRDRVAKTHYETWLGGGSVIIASFDPQTARVVVSAPNTLFMENIQKRFHTQIVRSLRGILGIEPDIGYVIAQKPAPAALGAAKPAPAARPEPSPAPPDAAQEQAAKAAARAAKIPPPIYQQPELHPAPPPTHGLNTRYTFEHLIKGGFNMMAAVAAEHVAEKPAQGYNPLFIYGGVGLGKTHIMHAIGHRAMELMPGCRVLYVSSETFTNELINAIRENRNEEFRNRYRTNDILLIDDIQFIAGKESTQEEFFHTFNALVMAGKQVVLTSDRHPKVMATLNDRLRSRFEGGLIADVSTPDLESRMAILRQRASAAGLFVPIEVVDYVAHKIQSNIRELEGALNKITMLARMGRVPVSIELATQALNDTAMMQRRRNITPGRVVEMVAKYYRCSEKDMRGRSRARDIVVPRQVAMYIMRQETDRSLADIGQELGGRDHTTVIHGTEKVVRTIEESNQFRQEVLTIREMLYSD